MTERSKTERFERTEENVDNRIQYVGQIAREGKLSNKKPKSRNKPSDKQKRMADEERGEEIFTFHPSPFTLERLESGRRT